MISRNKEKRVPSLDEVINTIVETQKEMGISFCTDCFRVLWDAPEGSLCVSCFNRRLGLKEAADA